MNSVVTPRRIVAGAVRLLLFVALPFAVAGTLNWVAGWVWVGITLGYSIGFGFMLAKHDPELLKERMSPLFQKEQKGWDKIFFALLIPTMGAWLVLMPLDAVRFGWSSMPVWAQILGAAGLIVGFHIIILTARANTYLSPVVKIQRDRGHEVISKGPYGIVRHPMYAAGLLILPGTALLMGSWMGLAASPILISFFAARTVLEERTLREELGGYAAYMEKVRYRWVPGVW